MNTFWVLLLCVMGPDSVTVDKSFTPITFESRTLCEETLESEIFVDSYSELIKNDNTFFICKEVK